MHSAPDTSKYSHLAEEEMQVVAAPETELPFGETSGTERILSFLNHHHFLADVVLNLFSPYLQGLLLSPKATPPQVLLK